MRRVNLIRYWLPVVIWAAIILQASGRRFDAPHTTSLFQNIFEALGLQFSAGTLFVIDHMARKAAHLTEYGILTALSFRAVREDRRGFALRWAAIAFAITVCVASTDETLQSFTPTRTGTPWDVLLDSCGATVALLMIRLGSGLKSRVPTPMRR
jgi:VanZ family protein